MRDSFEFTSSVELVSLYTMSPIGRIALDVEQMRISQAMREMELHETLTVVGAHVDGVYALAVAWNEDLKFKLSLVTSSPTAAPCSTSRWSLLRRCQTTSRT